MKRVAILSTILTIVMLVSSACSVQPATTAAPPTIAPVKAPEPNQTEPAAKTLTVLAAASLTEPFNEIGKLFEAQNPGAKVVFSYGGSQQLAQQLDQGAPADVFASASKKYMDVAVKSNRVITGTQQIFA